MLRWSTYRKTPSPIPRLQALVAGDLTTAFSIALATGISEREMGLLLVGRIEPTDGQRDQLGKLLKNYKLATKLENAEMMKGRL